MKGFGQFDIMPKLTVSDSTMKSEIGTEIAGFIEKYSNDKTGITYWRKPLVGFAQADDPGFAELKSAVSPTHALPTDLLTDAKTAVSFFIPFTKDIAASNSQGRLASQQWGLAYIETNQLIADISDHMKSFLEDRGFRTTTIPATHNFDETKLISDWSHRHVARIAGLGNFGINNMLITESGCCGRFGSFITTAPVEPDHRSDKEFCLYRKNGTCGVCVKRCVNGALSLESFDRHRCYEMCLTNEANLKSLGKADVCGKCVVSVPCAHTNPCEKAYR